MMRRILAALLILINLILSAFIFAQETGTVTDIDGNVYQTVKIGVQWWMAENLKVTHYNNGDAIPNVTDNTEWDNLTSGAYCNYNNDVTNIATYGRLYNFYTVKDARGIAPNGWHVSTEGDWEVLAHYLGGAANEAGGKLKEAGFAHWNYPNNGATNESGFTALPAGMRWNGSFKNLGGKTLYWSTVTSSPPSGTSYQSQLNDYSAAIFMSGIPNNWWINDGYSICYVKNSPAPGTDFIGEPLFGVVPLEVQFLNRSTGYIIGYDWDFGDETSSTEQDPIHIFNTRGIFTINLDTEHVTFIQSEMKENHILCLPSLPPECTNGIFSEDFESIISDLWTYKDPGHWAIQDNNSSLCITDSDYSPEVISVRLKH
ncbi:PKD domain-containing protein [candidate division KSB1 bacterium]|nr:PKD domain-containing protein [candidate division KSB1 bacterium]